MDEYRLGISINKAARAYCKSNCPMKQADGICASWKYRFGCVHFVQYMIQVIHSHRADYPISPTFPTKESGVVESRAEISLDAALEVLRGHGYSGKLTRQETIIL